MARGEREAFPSRLSGPISSSQQAPGWEATFTGTVTYDLQDATPNPDGSVTATYDMSDWTLPSVMNHIGDGCGYKGTGSGEGWTAGALELTRANDGTVTYTLLFDVKVEGVTYHAVGCDPPEADYLGSAQAYLDAAPRPAEPGMRLHASGATDVTSHMADSVSASWDLTPAPD
jgi:hypothetical protein